MTETGTEHDGGTISGNAEKTRMAQRNQTSIQAWIEREYRPAHHAVEACKPGTETEHDREELRERNAANPCHVRIVDAGTDHRSEPGPVQQPPKRRSDGKRNEYDRKPISRKA